MKDVEPPPKKKKKKDLSEKAALRVDYDKKYEQQRDRRFQAKWQIDRPQLELDDKKGTDHFIS